MKVIDLLNKIANGEEVKAFKYYGHIFKYDIDSKLWKNENGAIFSTYCYVEECLNDEVEIIEEEKKMPEKIKDKYCSQISKVELAQKYNEIIDYLKSKGE